MMQSFRADQAHERAAGQQRVLAKQDQLKTEHDTGKTCVERKIEEESLSEWERTLRNGI
jgi:hypothetical protein